MRGRLFLSKRAGRFHRGGASFCTASYAADGAIFQFRRGHVALQVSAGRGTVRHLFPKEPIKKRQRLARFLTSLALLRFLLSESEATWEQMPYSPSYRVTFRKSTLRFSPPLFLLYLLPQKCYNGKAGCCVRETAVRKGNRDVSDSRFGEPGQGVCGYKA